MFKGSIWILIALIVIIVIAGIFGLIWYFIYQKKKWNLKVEFKLPRSDGKIIGAEWGKGAFMAKSGKVLLKRKGLRKHYMKPFDIRKYLQGSSTLTVIQIAPQEYLPVLPRSYLHLIDDKTGKETSILEVYADTGKSRSWKNYLERELTTTFSIQNLFQQFGLPITLGIVVLLMFIGFSILWSRIPSICSKAAVVLSLLI